MSGSCFSEMTVSKGLGLAGGSVAAALALGQIGLLPGVTYGERVVYIGGGLAIAGAMQAFMSAQVAMLPMQLQSGIATSALSAGGLTYLALPSANLRTSAVVGASAAAAYWAGCKIASMVESKYHW